VNNKNIVKEQLEIDNMHKKYFVKL
jgi:hypothetical protein